MVTLVPRVQSFANKYVTKAEEPYSAYEKKISSLTALIFNSEGNFVYKLDQSSGATSLTLNKSLFAKGDMANSTVVLLANITLGELQTPDGVITDDNIKNLTVSALQASTYTPSSIPSVIKSDALSSINGLPMIGGQKGINLSASKNQQDPIEIGLKMLYAKINFQIAVADEGGENQYLHDGVKFNMKGCNIYNTTLTTTLAIPDIKDQPKMDFLGNKVIDENGAEIIAETDGATPSSSYYNSDATPIHSESSISKGNQLDLTFYILESRFNHGVDVATIYPWKDSYGNVLEGYESYQQMYKPKLVTKAGNPNKGEIGLATNVRLSGTYTDYRGTDWNVDYTVYLGKDNSQNFQVDRNSEYTNIITIKGIRNSSNAATGDGEVWIDHRVDVSYAGNSADDCVTITRETLVDSHIEVRPLRVNLPEGERVWLYLPKYNGSQVEEKDDNINQNWIGVENNDGRIQDFTKYCPNGKRKYFTTSLIEELYLDNTDEKYGVKTNTDDNNKRYGQKYIQLFNGDCVWIYIDENVTEFQRDAVIELVFYNKNLEEIAVESFNIIQGGLTKVADKYYIESYEEYLHTYDSQDLYTDPTKDYTQQGYKWGLEGKTLSKTQTVTSIGVPSDDYKYDYFHATDLANSSALFERAYSILEGNASENVGLNFTNWVGISDEMPIIDMGTRPESAIQYCLSKNKFRVDESSQEKHTMDIHWYLPDAYEMSDILSGGKDQFSDFNDNFYWTSQPSWNTTLTAYIYEDKQNARAVSLAKKDATEGVYPGTNLGRSEHHRIRCAYDPMGIENVDFSGNRAPEGIGAMRFYMRAWKDWKSEEKGYFNWLPQDDTDKTEIKYELPDNYDYPRDADDANQYFGNYLEDYGFELDPSDSDNWKKKQVSVYTSEVVLGRWPGLTTSNVVERTTSDITGNKKYYVLDGTKKESKGTTTTYFTEYNGDITISEMKPLDYLLGGNDLNILFAKADGTKLPEYAYYKRNGIQSLKTTRTWIPPTYKANDKKESVKYGPIRTPEGPVILTPSEENKRAERKGTVLTNSEGYIYPDKQSAIHAGVDAAPDGAYDIVSEPEAPTDWFGREDEVRVYSYKEKGMFGSEYTRYYEAVRYRYKLTYTLDGQTVTYYSYESEGRWDEHPDNSGSPNNYANESPTDDQLTMYGGNSFSIKANNGNKISSVKIYFSGSNLVSNITSDYLRFTKDGWIGDTVPPGMTYSGNGDTGSMTWNGEPTSEITFKLVRYKENYSPLDLFHLFDPISLEYLSNSDGSKSASIVIDQIDVRYMK